MTCNKIKTGLRSSPPQSTGRLTRVVLSCSSVRSSKQARVRSLATTRAAIVGQSSSYQPEKPMFCRLCTHPSSQVRMCTSYFQMEGWPNPEIGLCWSASGTVVTWCSKSFKRLCIVLCNSMIPDLVNMISLYRFDTTFNNVWE